MILQVLDQLSLPGKAGRPNEDRCGHEGAFAWMIDGATGLAESSLLGVPSDAAWLAESAGELLREIVVRDPAAPLSGIVRSVIIGLVRKFEAERTRAPEHRYELPSASLVLMRAGEGLVEAVSIGDSALFLSDGEGKCHVFTKSRDRERFEAGRLLDRTGRQGEALQSAEVMQFLRQVRNQQNVEGGYWVLGLEPAAADHLQHFTMPLTGPLAGPQAGRAMGLLATDGFAALSLDYERYRPDAFLKEAEMRGLSALGAELRHLESVEDPDCRLYPRFKPSDDATGLLFRLM